jgi:prophage endopeptidase
MPLLLGLPWRAIGGAVLAIALIAVGWTARGWQADAEIGAIHARNATATAKASEDAREREQVLADAIAQIDAEHTAERTKADAENSDLRAAVAAGDQRLYVRTICPAAGLPHAAASAGLDQGTRAELSADARQDYHALREGLMAKERQLVACQDIVDRFGTRP